jgi:hypothetical protein
MFTFLNPDRRSLPRVLRVIAYLAIALLHCGCAGMLTGTTGRPFYRPQSASDEETITSYRNGNYYKTAGYTHQTPSGPMEVSVFQNAISTDPANNQFSPLRGSGYGAVISFVVVLHNGSSRHTFNSFHLVEWQLVDSNGRVWNFLKARDASNSTAMTPDCVPGSEVRGRIAFGSAYYASATGLPDRLTLKIKGSLEPDSYNNRFEKDLIFERIVSSWQETSK